MDGSKLARRLRRGALAVVAVSLLGGAAVFAANAWIRAGARPHVHTVSSVPAAPVVLVLGAQVYPDGTPSGFLAARLEIARQLFASGKVRAVLVSGDHGQWSYDEPGAMAAWLTARGVPASRVVQDHAGFDTYDSCQRARRIFGARDLIVVTQSYHLERAVTLCRDAGLSAVGVGDDTSRQFVPQWRRAQLREYGAAVKAAIDVLTGRDPAHLGRREPALDDAVAG
ncbi:SanA/YdcF family protein [Pilimelia columellifera]